MHDSHITEQWNLTTSRRRDIARNSVWLNKDKRGNSKNNNVVGKDKGYAVSKVLRPRNGTTKQEKVWQSMLCNGCLYENSDRGMEGEEKTRRRGEGQVSLL